MTTWNDEDRSWDEMGSERWQDGDFILHAENAYPGLLLDIALVAEAARRVEPLTSERVRTWVRGVMNDDA